MLGVKDNQPSLAEAIKLWFDAADAGKLDRPYWDDIQSEKDHGRIETRRCLVTNDVAWLRQEGTGHASTAATTSTVAGQGGPAPKNSARSLGN